MILFKNWQKKIKNWELKGNICLPKFVISWNNPEMQVRPGYVHIPGQKLNVYAYVFKIVYF